MPYVHFKIGFSMSKRPRALRGMLVGKTKNDELTLQTIQRLERIEYFTPKETQGIINILIKQGRIMRLD
tara:strand:- start:1706 stop:1912 length:207 start_codon:yes stop_codon:yes gene_type:complete